MFYRVVIQGRTLGGADVDEVKQQFIRVTGLPARVAEQMFGGMPQVIKRQVLEPDAERIAATLRAIGAAATVERETPGADDETADGGMVISRPFNAGPPTIIPGMEALPDVAPASLRRAQRRARMRRFLRSKWTLPLAGAVLVAAGILLAPAVEDFVAGMRGTSAPARVAPVRAPATEIEPSALIFNAGLLQGPWRCTDQRSGVSAYWSYGANGTLIFHGDVLSERPPPAAVAATAPIKWALDGQRLIHTYAQRAPDTYTLSQLTLTRLRYGGERRFEVECRRP